MGRPFTRFPAAPVGADALVGPFLPITVRPAPAKREQGVSGPSPGNQRPQGERVSSHPKRGTANHPSPAAGGTRLRGPTRRSDFFFWTVHCAAVGGFAAYGCGVPLAGTARFLFFKNKKKMGGALLRWSPDPRPIRTHPAFSYHAISPTIKNSIVNTRK